MSYQQINLYQKSKQSVGLAFNLPTVAIATAVLAAILVALGLSQNSANSELAEQLQASQLQLQQLRDRNSQMQEQLSENSGINSQALLQQKQQQLAHLQQVRELMRQQQTSLNYSFAEQMSGLAQNHIAGISLQQIHLLNGGSYLAIGGQTQPAETALRYLQKLQQDERFDRARFGTLQMQRDQHKQGLIQFQLGDMPEPEMQL